LKRLRRYRESLADWDRAIELDDGPQRDFLGLGRADCLARMGRGAEAVPVAQRAAAANDAGADVLCYCAGIFALAAGHDPAAGDRYAARAVDYLRRALARGYDDIPHLLADQDLAPLRRRADYADLLWDLADVPSKP